MVRIGVWPGACGLRRLARGTSCGATAALLMACSSADHAEPTSHDAGTEAATKAKTARCDQSLADGTTAPTRTHLIEPTLPVTPFYQWESDWGYCGETSFIQAGLAHGQWMSQFNARLVCGAQGSGADAPVGTPLSQSGPDGFCAKSKDNPDYNAQLLLEDPAPASARQCLANARLDATIFDYATQQSGLAGYQQYMAWVKQQVILGRYVTIGVLEPGGGDPQYDHIVTVRGIGTDHDPSDATYHGDDVLYLEDHGAYTFEDGQSTGNPSIPPGAGDDTKGCTPYFFGYTFDALPMTRSQADGNQAYAILIPGGASTHSYTGGDGVHYGPSVTGHNYAFAVSGPVDTDGSTLPVSVRIAGTTTNGKANPVSPLADYNYENPYIGTSDDGDSCTNDPPAAWMTIDLEVTVSGLTQGTDYNLYEYRTDTVQGVGSAAALAVPTASFNAQAAEATETTPFTATGPTFTRSVTRSSKDVVVFRAVARSAP